MTSKKNPAPRWRAGGRVTLNSECQQNSAAKAILEVGAVSPTLAADAMIRAAGLHAGGTATTSRERLSPARRVASGGAGEPREGLRTNGPIDDCAAINRAALASFPAVLARILPSGKRIGAEVIALNPRHADRQLGSFKVNRYNGRWVDFATGDKGGDPISLVAYLSSMSQDKAALLLAHILGLKIGGPRHG